ncbi:MAG: ABC transporter permease [Chloroflexi bacterium]|nr:ABC transporter permease [Chloroflexota bacterium]
MSDHSLPAPSSPAVSLAAPRSLGGRARPSINRSGALVEVWLRAHTALTLAFLYLPIVVVVVFSFNTADRVTDWDGFGLRWYEHVLNDRQIQRYFLNSVIVGLATAIIATIIGTMAALGIQRAPRWFRVPFDAITYVSVIVPELVIALATLIFFATTIGRGGIVQGMTGGPEIGFGYHTIVSALALFNISLVLLLVRARLSSMDRTMVEASYDLFGTPWRTFWQITFPQLLPAVVAGFLLSFTFAFDDYLITTFLNGRGTSTIPLYVFSSIRKGVTPATNAVAAIILLVTLTLLLVGQFVLSRNARRVGARNSGGVAGIVTESQGG